MEGSGYTMIYLLLAIAATTIGTLVGVGGGFIIRPLLNLLDVSKGLASFTSSITVFSMAVTNLILYKKQGNKLQLNNIVYMGIGGIIGGLVGGSLMAYVPEQIINSLYLAAILVMLDVYKRQESVPCGRTSGLRIGQW